MSLFRPRKSNGWWMNTGIKTRYMYVISIVLKSHRPSKTSFHPDNKPKRTEIRITVNRFSTFCTQEHMVTGECDKKRPSDISYVNHQPPSSDANSQSSIDRTASWQSTDAVNMLTSKIGAQLLLTRS